MPRGRGVGLSRQARQYGAVAFVASDVAAPLGTMMASDRLNILLVDDQAAKLRSYEAILGDLGENLVKANSAKQALELLLKLEIALVLVDVCMPELDGFELA